MAILGTNSIANTTNHVVPTDRMIAFDLGVMPANTAGRLGDIYFYDNETLPSATTKVAIYDDSKDGNFHPNNLIYESAEFSDGSGAGWKSHTPTSSPVLLAGERYHLAVVPHQFDRLHLLYNDSVSPLLEGQSYEDGAYTTIPDPFSRDGGAAARDYSGYVNYTPITVTKTLSPDFQMHKYVEVSGNGSTVTDAIVEIEIYNSAGADADNKIYLDGVILDDFSDIRFMDLDGTDLAFELVWDIARTYKIAQVKIPSVHADGTYIKIHYNNYDYGNDFKLLLCADGQYGATSDNFTRAQGLNWFNYFRSTSVGPFGSDLAGYIGGMALGTSQVEHNSNLEDITDSFKFVGGLVKRFYVPGVTEYEWNDIDECRIELEKDTTSLFPTVADTDPDVLYGSFDEGDYHIVILDSNYSNAAGTTHWGGVGSQDDSFIGTVQRGWLATDLAGTTKKTLLFSGKPFAQTDTTNNYMFSSTITPANYSVIEDGEDGAWGDGVRTIIEDSGVVIACFHGGTYWSRHTVRNGIPYIQIPALTNTNDRTSDFTPTTYDRGQWLEVTINDLNKNIKLDVYQDDTTDPAVVWTHNIPYIFDTDEDGGNPSNGYLALANGYSTTDGYSGYDGKDVGDWEIWDNAAADRVYPLILSPVTGGDYNYLRVQHDFTISTANAGRTFPTVSTDNVKVNFSVYSRGGLATKYLGGEGMKGTNNEGAGYNIFDIVFGFDGAETPTSQIRYKDSSGNYQSILGFSHFTWYAFEIDINFTLETYSITINGTLETPSPVAFRGGTGIAFEEFIVRCDGAAFSSDHLLKEIEVIPYEDTPPEATGTETGTWIAFDGIKVGVNKPVNHRKKYQRDITTINPATGLGGSGAISFTGSSSGVADGNVERRWDGGTWTSVTELGGAASFTAEFTEDTGEGILELRDADNPTTIYRQLNNVGVGEVFVVAGQSNGEAKYFKRFKLSDSAYVGSLVPGLFRQEEDRWRELKDPTHTLGFGSPWVLLAAKIMDLGIPVGLITTAEGATTLSADNAFGGDPDWGPKTATGGDSYDNCVNQIEAADTNGFLTVLWDQCEHDALFDVLGSAYTADLKDLPVRLKADLGYTTDVNIIVRQMGNQITATPNQPTGEPDKLDEMRTAQWAACDDISYIHHGPIVTDLSTVLHWFGTDEGELFTERWFQSVARIFYGSGENRGPVFGSANITSSTTIRINFTEGNGALTGFDNAETRAAFIFDDDDGVAGTKTITGITSPTATSIVLTISAAIGANPTIGFAKGIDGTGIVFRDNSDALGLDPLNNGIPIEPFYEGKVGIDVSSSVDTLTLTEYSAAIAAAVVVSAGVDTLALTEYQTNINAGLNISVGFDTLTLTEYSANINAALNISAGFDTLTLTEYSVTSSAGTGISAGVDSLTLAEYPSIIAASLNIQAGVDTLILTEYSPTINTAINISASVDVLTLTEYSSIISIVADIPAGFDSLALTEYPSTITAVLNILAGFDTLTLTGYPAIINDVINISASVDSLTLAEYSATINAALNISAGLDTLILTEYSATIAAPLNILASVDNLTLTEYSAMINAAINISASVDTLILTEYQTTTHAGTNISASVDSLTLSEYKADIEAPLNILASVDTLILTEYQTNINTALNIPASVDTLTLTEYQTNINDAINISTGVDSLTLTEYSAAIAAAIYISAGVDVLTLTEYQAIVVTTTPSALFDFVAKSKNFNFNAKNRNFNFVANTFNIAA